MPKLFNSKPKQGITTSPPSSRPSKLTNGQFVKTSSKLSSSTTSADTININTSVPEALSIAVDKNDIQFFQLIPGDIP